MFYVFSRLYWEKFPTLKVELFCLERHGLREGCNHRM